MPFDLNPFIENITNYGTVKSSSYDVSITLPKALQAKATDSNYSFINSFTDLMPYRVISCSTPNAALLMNESNKWGIGPRIRQPYHAAFGNIKMTFLADEDAVIESFCNLWMNTAYNYGYSSLNQATFMTAYRGDVVSPSVRINKYNRSQTLISTYVLTDCMPILFAPSPMGWDQTDDLAKFMLELQPTTYDVV
jgi:hypothetical protein